MNRKEKNPAGMILRAERNRQGKGQKEVCYGICVVSYLSKIERGSAEPDMACLLYTSKHVREKSAGTGRGLLQQH